MRIRARSVGSANSNAQRRVGHRHRLALSSLGRRLEARARPGRATASPTPCWRSGRRRSPDPATRTARRRSAARPGPRRPRRRSSVDVLVAAGAERLADHGRSTVAAPRAEERQQAAEDDHDAAGPEQHRPARHPASAEGVGLTGQAVGSVRAAFAFAFREQRRHHGTLASLAASPRSTCAGERGAAVPAEVALRAVRRPALPARHVAGAGRRLDPDRLGGDGLGRECRGARRRRRRPAPGSSPPPLEARPRRRLGRRAGPAARSSAAPSGAAGVGRPAGGRRRVPGSAIRSPSNSRNAPHTQNSVPSGWRRLHLRQTITASRSPRDRQRLARAHDAVGDLPRLLHQQRVLGDRTPAPDRRRSPRCGRRRRWPSAAGRGA